MKPQYVRFRGFTAVFTPHFLEQAQARGLHGHMMPASHIERVWSIVRQGAVSGYHINGGYAYCRKIWNEIRRRWELEYISYTPSNFFHTMNIKSAQLVTI